mmetsp:Transcript_23851/g.52587  ORF Transcript_23851/g.52587 Transcript_23851/m.52587 type:complete len:166 (-) Transcript_23851:6-503(-)
MGLTPSTLHQGADGQWFATVHPRPVHGYDGPPGCQNGEFFAFQPQRPDIPDCAFMKFAPKCACYCKWLRSDVAHGRDAPPCHFKPVKFDPALPRPVAAPETAGGDPILQRPGAVEPPQVPAIEPRPPADAPQNMSEAIVIQKSFIFPALDAASIRLQAPGVSDFL